MYPSACLSTCHSCTPKRVEKIRELEEELKIVGQNLQQLEVSEEKAMAREENYQKQIRELLLRSVKDCE